MKALWFAAAAALVIALPAHAQQQGVTADTITIGAHGPITGPAAYIGLAGRDGMLLAIKEINAAGGVNGRKITAVFEDDGHTPTKALAAVKKLVEQDKVFAVMSVGGSNATVGAVDYMKERASRTTCRSPRRRRSRGRTRATCFAVAPRKRRATASSTRSSSPRTTRRSVSPS